MEQNGDEPTGAKVKVVREKGCGERCMDNFPCWRKLSEVCWNITEPDNEFSWFDIMVIFMIVLNTAFMASSFYAQPEWLTRT